MLQEDSNGEASFEIIEKKPDDSSNNYDKTESLSSVSSAYSIPSPSLVNVPGSSGNLLSNVAPPSSLPDFTLWPSPSNTATPHISPLPASAPPANLVTEAPALKENFSVPNYGNFHPTAQPFPPTQFSAAIPPSKGYQHGILQQNTTESGQSMGVGLIGWMKEAVATGGILSKVAEKAKNSVDSLITTLDPQMSDYIYSGGDLEFTVASNNDEEISSIKEAVHNVFGKAWINGNKLGLPHRNEQAVGLENGALRAEEKLVASLKDKKTPTIAIENILLHHNDDWFDLSILILRDMEKQKTVHTFTQTTPIPLDEFLKKAESVLPEISKYENTEQILSTFLQKKEPGWHLQVTGISRKEILTLAAKTLLRTYKNQL